MPKRKKKTNLKDQVTVGVAVIIVAAVVALTYSYRSSAQVAVATTPTPSSTATPSPTPSPKPSASPTPTPDSKNYLYIKELGIKIPLTTGLYDIEYSYVGPTVQQPYAQLEFSTATIDPLANGFCTPENEPLGGYVASKATLPLKDGQLVSTVNGYYIYYTHVQYVCGDTPAEIGQVEALIDPLHTAVSLAQPIN